MKRLLVINNVPSHYRAFMFKKMSELGQRYGIEVTVAFQAEREPHRSWNPDRLDLRFRHFVSTGINPWSRRRKRYFTVRTFNTDILWGALVGGFDWVLMAPFMSVGTWVIAIVPLGRTRKLLWSESNLVSARRSGGLARWFKRLLQKPFAVIVCPGQRALEYVLDLSPELSSKPVFWLPNIVDTTLYGARVREERTGRDAIRAELGVTPDETLILGVGQMIERKGFHLLIDAVGQVGGRYKVMLVGDGPLRKAWSERVAAVGAGDHVRLRGEADPVEVARYLAAADWFVHTALQDPSPLAVVEAAVAGLPLAVSVQTGNGPEAVLEGENGFTFDPTDRKELIGAVRRMVTTPPEERFWMGRRSAEIARERFDPDVVINSFFQKLLKYEAEVCEQR